MTSDPMIMVAVLGLVLGVYGLFEKRRYDRLTRELEEAEAASERETR